MYTFRACGRRRTRESLPWPLHVKPDSALVLIVLLLHGVLLLPLFSAGAARSQGTPGGNISVFADPSGASCFLVDEAPGAFSVYIVHNNLVNGHGMSGWVFALVTSDGFGASYIGETIPFPTYFGSLREGIVIVHGCVAGPVLLATVQYQGHGSSEPCSYLDVGPHRTYLGGILTDPEVQDCLFELYPAPSMGTLLVNPVSTLCTPWCVVATRETTWGRVKALYR